MKSRILEIIKGICRKGGGSRASGKKAKEEVLERERLLLEMKFGKR